MHGRPTGASALIDFLQVARRRKLIILQAVVLVTAVAAIHAARQPHVYSSNAQVLLNRDNIAATYAGVPDATSSEDPARYGATQVFLARSPKLAADVAKTIAVPGLTGPRILQQTSVYAATNADILGITAHASDAATARTIAAVYARAFVAMRRQRDTVALQSALAQVRSRVRTSRADNQSNTPSGQALLNREQELETLAALETQNTYVARPASNAVRIAPRPLRSMVLGFVVGLALGLGLALLRDTFDTTVRSVEEIAARLRIPSLGRLAPPPRELVEANRLLMLEQPYTPEGELFRMLRTSLDLTNVDHEARSLMITSSVEDEGKTTTVSNLAVALAVSGRDVIVVDLDLRRPALGRAFGLPAAPGLTDVVLGEATLDDALVNIDLAGVRGRGGLRVLPSGAMPPTPAEFVGSPHVHELLRAVQERCDVVLVDTPPVLHAAETMTLSSWVDAVVVVVRLNVASRSSITELGRLLETMPAAKLGFVVAGAATGEDYQYSNYGYGYGQTYPYPDRDLVQ